MLAATRGVARRGLLAASWRVAGMMKMSSVAEGVTLSPELVQEAAQRLADAKLAGTTVLDVSDEPQWLPRSHADMYAVQDALINLPEMQGRLAGWKIGATNAGTQARLGLSSPFAGPIFDTDIVTVPMPAEAAFDASSADVASAAACEPVYTVDTSHGTVRGFEAEFGVTLRKALPAIVDVKFSPEQVGRAVDSVMPVIEVVGTRTKTTLAANVALLVADFGGHGSLLVPEARYHHDADMVEWPSISARMVVNGEEANGGDFEDALGHPIFALTWLANHLTGRGRHLHKGDIVATGTVTGLTVANPGDKLYATFDAYAKFGLVGPVAVL